MDIIIFLSFGLPIIIFLLLRSRNPVTERTAPHIIIEAALDKFIFQTEHSKVELKPYLYLNSKHKVVAIGQDVNDDADLVRVDLFKYERQPKQEYYKVMVLEAFLRFGIAEVGKDAKMRGVLKPIITFKGLETFGPLMCGYHKYTFDTLLRPLALNVSYE